MHDDKRSTSNLVPATVSYQSGVADVIGSPSRAAIASGERGANTMSEDLSVLQNRVLGDFVLGQVLGQGGCGIVYRAEQRTLGRLAVVKVIQRSQTTRRHALERFAREARLASRFDHPYAAHIYSFGIEHDGLMWIAMEFVDGTPLGQLIRRSAPLPLHLFIPLFERLCEVVQSAHDQGIIHRDIKPSNVMVIARAGRLMPKLLDFGLAKLVGVMRTDTLTIAPTERSQAADAAEIVCMGASDASRSLTHDGQVLGSPMYMAPEQWCDATTAGPLADQYALALVAYEALTGSRAFTGPTVEALAEQHLHAPLPALSTHLPTALHAVLARASDKIPDRRFSNLTEFATAIRIATLGTTNDLEPSIAALPDDATPYPGLAAYGGADHASFVGRERDVEALLDRLDTQSIVTVIGPSGSGKTSFLAAGLIPSLAPGWRAELVRPGSDPLGVLVALMKQHDAPPYRGAPRDDAAVSPAVIARGLVDLAETCDIVLVVIVDQVEELFTMCVEQTRRAAFAEALVAASASSHIRVVLALRDDFLCRIEQLPAWRRMLGRAVYVLGIPRQDELERMITVPARRRGFGFDDPALPREIVDQVADRPGALPLIAFTAAQLWEHRDPRLRLLTREAYERIGGVIGALVQHADSVVDRMSSPERRQVRLMFRRLITAEGTRALISRSELESSLGEPSAATVVDRLLAARLIVSRDDDAGDRIEIIHETLATTWPRLAAWRREDADGARFQEQLAIAVRHWNECGQPADLLWRGNALSDLRRWQDGGDRSMTSTERGFVRACIESASRTRRTRIGIVMSSFAVLLAGILGLVSANRKIVDQRAAAIDRLCASFEEHGRRAIADGDDVRGMLYLGEASRLGAHGPGFDLLTSHAVVSLDAGLEIIGHANVGIVGMEVDPTAIITVNSDLVLSRWDRTGRETHLAHGTYYVTLVGDLTISISSQGDVIAIDRKGAVRWRAARVVADASTRLAGIVGSAAAHLVVAFSKTATLWDVETGRFRGELPHNKGVTAVAFDADGVRAATGDIAGVVRIWDTAKRELVVTCEPHAGAVRDLKFAPNKRSVVSGGNDGDVRICDTANGATLHRLVGHSHQVVTVDVTADGRSIASGGRDGKPRIWDAQTGLLIRVLEGHRGTVISVRFSPDDSEILSLGVDGTARIWSREGIALASLQGHGGPIYDGRWDTDRHVITTSTDGAIRRWDPERAINTTFRQGHTEPITDVVISSNDRWVLTSSIDGRAVLWDRKSLQPIVELRHDAKVLSALLGPDGTGALTMDDAGYARIWRLPAGALINRLGPGITAATYTHDGRIVTASDGGVKFWSSMGAELGMVTAGYSARGLVVDPTGRWLFVRGKSSAILVIDVAARKPVARLAIRNDRVLSLATDGSRVAVNDGAMIRLWQLWTWAPLGTLVGHKNTVANMWFVSDGRLVSAAADATLVWGRDMRLARKLADTSRVLALATSPDGALLATTGSDGEIRIWDAATYRLLLQLPGHRLPAYALQLTQDGHTVISGGSDGRLVTWTLPRRTRSPFELANIVRCRVPLRLEGDVALPRDLDFDDPTCRSLALDR